MYSINFNGILLKNDKPYTGWYEGNSFLDEYFINGKLVIQGDLYTSKYTIFFNSSLKEVSSKKEAERILKLLSFI